MYLINGCATELLPVQDRGLQYGDGVFETIAVLSGKPLCWHQHYSRLSAGCQRLKITCPQAELLLTEAEALIKNSSRSVLKIIITRGSGGRGYTPPVNHTPTRILALYPWPDYPADYSQRGIQVRLCQTRLARNSILAGIKHLNRLEQVLARAEWNDPQVAEGLMCDVEGHVVEGTMSNLFAITGNTLATPAVTECGIAGVIRARILELAPALGLQTQISTIIQSTLLDADEIFMCNSIIGIWPVRSIDGQKCKTGDWTQKIRAALIADTAIAP